MGTFRVHPRTPTVVTNLVGREASTYRTLYSSPMCVWTPLNRAKAENARLTVLPVGRSPPLRLAARMNPWTRTRLRCWVKGRLLCSGVMHVYSKLGTAL